VPKLAINDDSLLLEKDIPKKAMIVFYNVLVTVLYNMNGDIDLVRSILKESCMSQNMYDECQELKRKKGLMRNDAEYRK
jgi:hypothetical protein